MARVKDDWLEDANERDKTLERVKAEARALLEKELQDRAGDHFKLEEEFAQRRHSLDLELQHLRD